MNKFTNTTYSKNEVLEATMKYFKDDKLSTDVWINKYCLKDIINDEIIFYEKDPSDMHKRLSSEFFRIENKYHNPLTEKEIFDVLDNFKYIIPQGSPMSGIGNDNQIVSLSNCYVVGNESDSYGAICLTDEQQIQLMKRRGGVGHDLSHIRPKGSPVKNSAITSTGIVPFMERYSNSTNEVAQNGRRGALMLSISINHPDVEDFIDAKMADGKVTGSNISVKIDDEFMRSVENKIDYIQKYPIYSENPKNIKKINSVELWKKIIHNAWKSAEPGLLFWDTIIRESVPDCYSEYGFRTISTNPCGEIPLCANDSCRLLALNLYSYVINPFEENAYFDFDLFKKHVWIGQRLMDDIIDLEIEKIDKILDKIDSDPEDENIKFREKELWLNIKEKTLQGRRIGFGSTGEGDMLAALNKKYGTIDATEVSVNIHKFMSINAYKSSCNLAKERGPFPIYDYNKEIENPFINRLKESDNELNNMLKNYGRRNIALLTLAPTGSVSTLTQTTSGIEPVYLITYKRRRKIMQNDNKVKIDFVDQEGIEWEEYNVFHHKFIEWLKIKKYDVDIVSKMNDEELNKIIKLSPYYGSTSNDINWVEKVNMQGQIQKWIDHSISVTVNLPSNVTEELVSKVYETGWSSGCKGMTIYRDGSRQGVILKKEDKKEDKKEEGKNYENNVPKRPTILDCDVHRFTNKGEKWIGFIGIKEEYPYEIFTGLAESFVVPGWIEKGQIKKEKIKNKEGETVSRYDFIYKDKEGYEVIMTGLNRAFQREYWNIGKMTSALLRHRMHLPSIIGIIDTLNLDGDVMGTWKKGITRMLKKYIKEVKDDKSICPNCGSSNLIHKEGCVSCSECSWEKCS